MKLWFMILITADMKELYKKNVWKYAFTGNWTWFSLQINVRSTLEESVPSSRHRFRAYLNLLLLNSLAVTVLIIHLHPSEQTQNSFLLKSCSDLVYSKLNSSEVMEVLPLVSDLFHPVWGSCEVYDLHHIFHSNSKLMLCQWLQLHSSSHLQVRCTMLPALRCTWAVKPWVFPHLSSPGKRFVSLF